ncbi:hypothetical protein IU403_08610 [Aerococcaceae bacterium zg-BR22]|uniref:glycoside hydrolase family 2 protein n=1 Tax=Aerococcaceae bacterium zg-1292 TaxID=2774330 RepID=UPI00406379F5|nr:hypothetical protein [Aerococcaceae bacterium zg-BR22]
MRETKILDDNWKFGRLSEFQYNAGQHPTQLETVQIPHTWYREGAEDNSGYGYYSKCLSDNELLTGFHYVRFQAVSLIATVYFNGKQIGHHEGGYSAFTVSLPTELLRDENTLEVFVSNIVSDEISPSAGDFTIFGGIHRKVELISFDSEQHFDVTYFGTDGVIARTMLDANFTTGHLTIEPQIKGNMNNNSFFEANLFDTEQNRVVSWQFDKNLDAIVSNPMLWQGKENPYLYTLEVLYRDKTQIFDRIYREIGFRHIQMFENTGFYLNGQSMKINGIAKHNDSANVYSALNREELEKDWELIEEIGANALRLSHYQHPKELYEEADRRGYVVWAEIPLLKISFTETAKANIKLQMAELLLQNCHNPSICFWGVQNEVAIYTEDILAAPFIEEVKQYAESIDATRIYTVANLFTVKPESPLNQTTKMVGYNIYFGWYYGKMGDYGSFLDDCHEKAPEVALGVSEYGVDANITFHSSDPKVRDYSEEFQALFHETVYPQIQSRDFLWGSFIWNMFDFSSNHRDEGGIKHRNLKGLVTYDRKLKKDAFYYYKAQWSSIPFVHLAEKNYDSRTEDVLSLKAYSNQSTVEFIVGSTRYLVSSDNGVFKLEVPFTDLQIEVSVRCKMLEDRAAFYRVKKLPTTYIYRDANPGVNVQNWFENEEEKARLFPEDAYSIMDSIAILLDNKATLSVLAKYMPEHLPDMQKRGGNLPLHRIIYYLKGSYTEDDVQVINSALNEIKKY